MSEQEAISRILVLVPVLGRPQRVVPLLESLAASERHVRVGCLFLPCLDDHEEVAALEAAGATYALWPHPVAEHGQWARKINWAFRRFVRPHGWDMALLAADDLVFHPGWAEAVAETQQTFGACVVGTNDLGNPRVVSGAHSTHPCVHRDYLGCGTIDEAGLILHEGYVHQFVDDELVGTAMRRGVYVHAHQAVVEHRHPHWGKGKVDATYRRGQASFDRDRDYFRSRVPLWQVAADQPGV